MIVVRVEIDGVPDAAPVPKAPTKRTLVADMVAEDASVARALADLARIRAKNAARAKAYRARQKAAKASS